MSKFPRWFTKAYNRWKKSQAGEEDFSAFCDLLGYPATKVMSWLQGETEPQGPELLNIAGLFGSDVFTVLNQSEPDPELLKIYNSFPHLSGEDRSKLAYALLEFQIEMQSKNLIAKSEEGKLILSEVFQKLGFKT